MAVSGVSTYALKRAERELTQTKVIIRHLPPDITKELLIDILSPLPDHTSFVFVPGRQNDFYSYSRAYLNISNIEDIKKLRDTFDGHQLESFVNKTKYRMIIEYAPYQCSGSRRAKPDARCGTIEKDPDYLTFLENYEKEVVHLPSIDLSYLDHIEVINDVQATPLVDFINDKKFSRRMGGTSRNKVIYASGGSKKKREKVKVIEIKERSSRSSGYSSKDSRKDKSTKKINDTVTVVRSDKSLTNGNTTISSEKGRGEERKGDKDELGKGKGGESGGSQKSVVRSKDRPDQTFYSPRTTRNVRSGKGEERSSVKDKERSDTRGNGVIDKGEGKGGSNKDSGHHKMSGKIGKGAERSTGDHRDGSKRDWYKDDSSRSYGKKQQHSRNEHYYEFRDDDDEDTKPRSNRRDDHYSSRRDDHYSSSRRDNYYNNRRDDKRDDRYSSRRDDQYSSRRDDQYSGRRDDQYSGRRDDQYSGRRDDQYIGRRDDQYSGRRDDRRDNQYGRRGGRGGRSDYHYKKSS